MARFLSGWIKIYREAIEGDIGEDLFRLGLFVKLVGRAHRLEGDAELAGQRVKLKPGQIATGLRDLSPNTILDPHLHRVRTALRYLENRGTITQETSNQGRLVTICNWEEYQAAPTDESKQGASDAQTTRKQGASDAQHIGELRKKKKEVSAPASPEIKTAVEEWRKTLKARGIVKNPYSDQATIESILKAKGIEATLDAIRGLRFETGDKDYDPSKFCYLARLTKNRFEKFGYLESIGARHRDSDREPDFFDPPHGETTNGKQETHA